MQTGGRPALDRTVVFRVFAIVAVQDIWRDGLDL